MKTKPYAFQAADMPRIEKWRRALIAYAPGLGKTFMGYWYRERNIKGVTVVVCPALAKLTWAHESNKHCGMLVHVLYGRRPHPLKGGNRVYVINYDILGAVDTTEPTWWKVLKALDPELLIFDEIHKLRSAKASWTKACHALAHEREINGVTHPPVPHRLGLSGTPMVNRPIELFEPCAIINPEVFVSRWNFGLYFCGGLKSEYGGMEFGGASHLDDLNRTLRRRIMARRRREDVLKDLPPVTHSVVAVDLPRPGMKEYRKIVAEFLKRKESWGQRRNWDEENERRALISRAVHLTAVLKRPLVIDWVREFLEGSDAKLLVWGVHRKMVTAVHEAFKGQAVLVHGGTPDRLRKYATDRFNEDPACRVFVGNVEAGGVAWSCRSADTHLFAEIPWVPGLITQAIGRTRGISRGTGRPNTVRYIVAAGTIEERMCLVQQSKAEVIAEAVDGIKVADLKLFDALEAELVRAGKPRPKRGKKARR